MKRILLGALAALPMLVSAQQTYTLKGQVGSLNAPAKAYLSYRLNGANHLDSADIAQGAFSFQGTVEEPMNAVVVLAHKGEPVMQIQNPDLMPIFLESGEITVQSSDSLQHATLGGTPLNKDQENLNKAMNAIRGDQDALMSLYYGTPDEKKATPEFQKDFQARYAAFQEKQGQVVATFIQGNPNSLVSLYTLRSSVDPSKEYEKAQQLFSGLSKEIQASKAGEEYNQALSVAKGTAVGAAAPDFSMSDTTGKAVSLSSFKGKYVLVDFWASWCGPCRGENPHVVAAFNKYKDKNFTILGVSLDRPGQKEAWLKAIKDDGLAWTQVSDLQFWDNAAAKLYGVRAIPANFLIDPTGKIVAKDLRGEALTQKLEEVL